MIESRYVRPDGYPVWVSKQRVRDPRSGRRGSPTGGGAEDVTARRQAEENLRRARDDLERMVHERTAALKQANDVLNAEIEQRKHVEAALVQDFAERRKAQEALTESERRFRLFIQGVTDYAIFMLDPEGYITNWNSGAQRIHHYAAEEIVGQHFGCFYTEEEQQRGEPARALCRLPPMRASTSPKAGGCAATRACSGPASSSRRSATRRACWSDTR